jgi:hypothetical protein
MGAFHIKIGYANGTIFVNKLANRGEASLILPSNTVTGILAHVFDLTGYN